MTRRSADRRYVVPGARSRSSAQAPLWEDTTLAPADTVEQHPLVDHLGSGPHRLDRLLRAKARALEPRRGAIEARVVLDLDYLVAIGDELLEVGLLVLDRPCARRAPSCQTWSP
jgi:hypothetical protein